MSNHDKHLELVRMVLARDEVSPKMYPATFHNRRRRIESGAAELAGASASSGQNLLKRMLAMRR